MNTADFQSAKPLAQFAQEVIDDLAKLYRPIPDYYTKKKSINKALSESDYEGSE